MSAPGLSGGTVREEYYPTLAAGAAPGVADPPQAVAAERDVVFAQFHRADGHVVPYTGIRLDDGRWYVVCGCGYTTSYCDSNAQASRIAAHHSREAHGA